MDVIEAKSFETLDIALKWIYILSKKKAFGYSGGGSKKKDMAMSLYKFLDLLFFTARQEGIKLGLIKEDDFEPNLWKFFDHYKDFMIYVDDTGKHFIRVKELGSDDFTTEYLNHVMDLLEIKRYYERIRELADKDLLEATIFTKELRDSAIEELEESDDEEGDKDE